MRLCEGKHRDRSTQMRDRVLSLTRWTVWMIEPCWQNLMMSSWRGTGVEYDEYSSRMIARWEMKRIGDTRAWNYRCARIKYSSSQRCIYTMRARAIEREQTNAVAVMGTAIESERTRPFMPETGILKLRIRQRMNPFEHKSTRRVSMALPTSLRRVHYLIIITRLRRKTYRNVTRPLANLCT